MVPHNVSAWEPDRRACITPSCTQIVSSVNQRDKDRGEETLELSGGTDRKEQTNYGRVISGLVPDITNIHCFGPSGAEHNALFDMHGTTATLRLPKEGEL